MARGAAREGAASALLRFVLGQQLEEGRFQRQLLGQEAAAERQLTGIQATLAGQQLGFSQADIKRARTALVEAPEAGAIWDEAFERTRDPGIAAEAAGIILNARVNRLIPEAKPLEPIQSSRLGVAFRELGGSIGVGKETFNIIFKRITDPNVENPINAENLASAIEDSIEKRFTSPELEGLLFEIFNPFVQQRAEKREKRRPLGPP